MIEMPQHALEAIRRHGRETYPEECCGALLGEIAAESARIARVEALPNDRQEERRRRFRISPEEYIRAEQRAEQEGLSLVGFYHSHPDHPAVPSAYDREHALPFFHYVVLAVSRGEPQEVSSWVLSQDRGEFEREELVSREARR
jgi:proteasome lid subunit RPN8/RPN11